MTVETLGEFGLIELTDEEIRGFLDARTMGVLGLPTDGAPYLLPISYGFVGGDRLLFSYFVGDSSRKAELSDAAAAASFLVYSAESPFSWESVLLIGSIEELPAEAWDAHGDALADGWHLDVFQQADTTGTLRVYEFRIQDRQGLKYTELPPGFAQEPDDETTTE